MRRSLATTAVALLVAASPLQAQLFDFEGADSPLNTVTPFALTRGGVTATFTGTPIGLTVGSAVFFDAVTLTGRVLGNIQPIPETLEIQFSAPLTSIGFLFALIDNTNTATLTMNLFNGGGPLVGQVIGSGTIGGGGVWPEGALTYSGAAFDHVFVFATGAVGYAIDDVRVGAGSVVPEPATVALVATGLVAVGGVAARRRRTA